MAIAGLAITSIYHIDEVLKASGTPGYLPILNSMLRGALFEISALALSATAFALSWAKPSIVVSLILILTGILMTVDAVAIGTKYFSILTVPGPIIGFFYVLAVLLLGIVKAAMTARAMKTPPLAKNDPT